MSYPTHWRNGDPQPGLHLTAKTNMRNIGRHTRLRMMVRVLDARLHPCPCPSPPRCSSPLPPQFCPPSLRCCSPPLPLRHQWQSHPQQLAPRCSGWWQPAGESYLPTCLPYTSLRGHAIPTGRMDCRRELLAGETSLLNGRTLSTVSASVGWRRGSLGFGSRQTLDL